MTTQDFSTLPNTNPTEAIQTYIESGDMPLYDLVKAWETEDYNAVTSRVIRHFNATIGQCIGIKTNVRDAMQNIALTGLFTARDVRVYANSYSSQAASVKPQIILRFEWQADAMLRQLDGRRLTAKQKQWLASLADDLREAIEVGRYGKWDGKADGLGTPSNPRAACGHCGARAKQVQCRKCTRQMCDECISDGQLCGLCADSEGRA